jgi:hypothetical protein
VQPCGSLPDGQLSAHHQDGGQDKLQAPCRAARRAPWASGFSTDLSCIVPA